MCTCKFKLHDGKSVRQKSSLFYPVADLEFEKGDVPQ